MWRIIVYPLAAISALVLIVSDFYLWTRIMAWTEDIDNPIIVVSIVLGWPVFQFALGVGLFYWLDQED